LQTNRLILHTSLKFIDVTAGYREALKALAAPVLKLPQDFLYPFLVASAYQYLPMLSSSVISVIVLLSIS